jgi:glycosyltransferase involved in cell wall biosynthesis
MDAASSPRVTLVLPYRVFGAAEDYATIVAFGVREVGLNVTVLHLEGSVPDSVVGQFDAVGIQRVALSSSVMRSVRRLRQALRSTEPDVVHVNQTFLPAMVGAGLLSLCSTVVTAHNPALRPTYSTRGRALSAVADRCVDCWIVLSRRNHDLLRAAHTSAKHVRVIAPGLPTDRFARPLSRDVARDALGLPADAFIVGTVGRLAPQKRHDLLIRGAADAEVAVSNLHVVILGEGELREQTKRLADEVMPGRVSLLGHRSDIPRLLLAFDVFALPSDFEGLPFAMLEAMAVGLPIIASDVQGSGEALIDGVNGLLIEKDSSTELATAIQRVALDRRLATSLGDEAASAFRRKYTSDRMVNETEMLYRDLAQRHRPRFTRGAGV